MSGPSFFKMKKFLFPILLAVLCVGFVWAKSNIMENKDNIAGQAPDGPVVLIQTSMGDIKVKLYNDTPLHRDNFLKLAREGFYDGVLFHRVINNFMVQTGDPASKNAAPGQMLGASDPGYTIPAEIVYPQHYHKYGALAAARTGDQFNPERRSSGSQFYIVTGNKVPARQMEVLEDRTANQARQDFFRNLCKEHFAEIDSLRKAGKKDELEALRQSLIARTEAEVKVDSLPAQLKNDYVTIGGAPHLDNQYTVFGEVIEGMDVVENIQKVNTDSSDRPVEDIKVIKVSVLE